MRLTPEHLASLRAAFSRHCKPDNTQLKKIVMVGALGTVSQNGNAVEQLSPCDRLYLEKSLKTLEESGIAACNSFEVEIINRTKHMNEEDFLKSQPQADIIIICYIENHKVEDWTIPYAPDMRWQQVAKNSGAHVVITIGTTETEINIDNFTGNNQDDFKFQRNAGPAIPSTPLSECRLMTKPGSWAHGHICE